MIQVSQPVIGKQEIDAVNKAVSSGWVSSKGEYIEKFEESFAKFCCTEHCVLVSNGTVALHLALEVLNIGEGDEVIVPDLTFVATANVVKMAGAVPVFADISVDDWCLDPSDVEKKITSKTKAIIPVHIYGHPAPMNELQKLAELHGLHLIEDAAEAHGAEYDGKRVGGLGAMATFSFYGNKIITTGEGGAITTNNEKLASRARFLRDHGMSSEKRYWYTEVGYNYRMTNMQAALGYVQLNQIQDFLNERAKILECYKKHLRIGNIVWNPVGYLAKPVNWITCLVIKDFNSSQRDELLLQLSSKGVDTRPFFYPLSTLPMYERATCETSLKISSQGLNLPTFPGLKESEIIYICNELSTIIEHLRAK